MDSVVDKSVLTHDKQKKQEHFFASDSCQGSIFFQSCSNEPFDRLTNETALFCNVCIRNKSSLTRMTLQPLFFQIQIHLEFCHFIQ